MWAVDWWTKGDRIIAGDGAGRVWMWEDPSTNKGKPVQLEMAHTDLVSDWDGDERVFCCYL